MNGLPRVHQEHSCLQSQLQVDRQTYVASATVLTGKHVKQCWGVLPATPVANTSLRSPFWKHLSTSDFQAGKQPAWWLLMPRKKAGTNLSRTPSGLSSLQGNQNTLVRQPACAVHLLLLHSNFLPTAKIQPP
jgi:hypothetical protein